jgi:hypothetical protein
MTFRLFAFLILALVTNAPLLHAQEAPPAAPAAVSPATPAPAAAPPTAAAADDATAVTELIKNTPIYVRPKDFAEAQHLALQNRGERLEMLNRSIECVQKAKTMDDLAVCQRDEGKSLALIRLAYCDSTVSFPNRRQRTLRNAEGPLNTPPANTAVIISECEKAMSIITGSPPPGRAARRQLREQQSQPAQ